MPQLSGPLRRPRHATVVAYLALVIAMSGSAYAIGKASVGERELKNNAVTSKKIKNGHVKSKDLAKGSVTPEKLAGGLGHRVVYARVKANGQLVDGDAIATNRFGTGTYFVTFPPPIDKCAGSVTSSAFAGFDISINRVWGQLSIGATEGGGFGDAQVAVSLFDSGGSNVDSAFTMILVCPR